jgi:hypothetical protein
MDRTYALLSEDGGLALILDLEELLAAIGRVGDVQLERLSVLRIVDACNEEKIWHVEKVRVEHCSTGKLPIRMFH